MSPFLGFTDPANQILLAWNNNVCIGRPLPAHNTGCGLPDLRVLIKLYGIGMILFGLLVVLVLSKCNAKRVRRLFLHAPEKINASRRDIETGKTCKNGRMMEHYEYLDTKLEAARTSGDSEAPASFYSKKC